MPLDGREIRLGGAGQLLIRQPEPAGASAARATGVGASAVLHHLTDDALEAGVSLAEALEAVLDALAGRLLLAHHATLEVGFLTRACEQVWGHRVPIAALDTMQAQYRLLSKGFDDEPPPGALRLWAARDRYGLPRYRAHEALTDALACAELHLAQMAELGWQTPLRSLR